MVPNGRGTALLWVVFVAILGVMAWVMLRACGIALPDGTVLVRLCDAPLTAHASLLDAERQRTRSLVQEHAELERQLSLAAVCPVPKVDDSDDGKDKKNVVLEPCPEQRPVEVVLLLDASLSMLWDYNLAPDLEQDIRRKASEFFDGARSLYDEANRILDSGDYSLLSQAAELEQRADELWQQGIAIYDQLAQMPGKDRIAVAKESLAEFVDRSPNDVNFTYFSFNRCEPPHPRYHGRYSPAERSDLIRDIGGTEIDSETALVNTLLYLQETMPRGRTENEPINVVLVSDGEDSCGGDPCAVARQLKQAFPFVYVNVVGIGQDVEAVRCVADETGGKFLKASEAEALSNLLVRAAGQDVPQHCVAAEEASDGE